MQHPSLQENCKSDFWLTSQYLRLYTYAGCSSRKGQYSWKSEYMSFWRKKCIYSLVIFRRVSEIEVYNSQFQNCWQERDTRITYCFKYQYLLFKWQSWYSLLGIIHFRKLHRRHQCTLQLVWGHGVLLVCTVYSVLCSKIALSGKPYGIGHTYIYT
jgi:hypothetical protein